MKNLDPIIIDPGTFFRQHCTLPPLPEIVRNIQYLIDSADATVGNISAMIIRDPGLTGQILKIVNSAYFGFRKEIADIKFAVAYLGFNEIHNLVLSLSVVESLELEDIKELEHFWAHSVYCARCAKFLARKFDPLIEPEQIWLGAILHDIGKLVYYKFFPDHYKTILRYARRNGKLYSETESRLNIPSSAYVGQLLCQRWNLPDIIRQACEFHTLSDMKAVNSVQQNGFKKIICCANLMAVLASEPLEENTKQAIFNTLIQVFRCEKKELLTLMGEIYDLKL